MNTGKRIALLILAVALAAAVGISVYRENRGGTAAAAVPSAPVGTAEPAQTADAKTDAAPEPALAGADNGDPAPGTDFEAGRGEALGRLLEDLLKAYEQPGEGDGQRIEADLSAVLAISEADYPVAKAVADHWRQVYLDPDYALCCHGAGDVAPELEGAGIPDAATHAFVVLGYELQDGEMTEELKGRCEAAAAAARSFPNAILVCSGGATGPNNPDRHTEAGLMKQYLTEACGIDPARIFTDERAMTTAENAVNTFAIMKAQGVETMTIVTSSYHQRWGQALYNALAAIYEQQRGYHARLVGNYCFDTQPSVDAFLHDDRFAIYQLGEILDLPKAQLERLPNVYALLG